MTGSSSSTRPSAIATSWASGRTRAPTSSSPAASSVTFSIPRSLEAPLAEQETQTKPKQSVSDRVTNNYVWRSIFRHGYADTPRNRVLQVAGNVWLHLHPSKVRRHAVRFRFTWCAGGLTFLLYLVTVV